MTVFRVWAPRARVSVDVVVGDRRVAMTPTGERGWYTAEVAGAAAGDDYAFSLDGADPLPDPRSPWQPGGVHGPSRLVDHTAFPWTDTRWKGMHLPSAVLYELHVGTFSPPGTFEGVIGRLDHLVELGVDAVELMPVAQFSGPRGWGYDGVDLYAPHELYGGPDGLKRLVDACHARDLGVVLDVVYNHLGPEGNHLDRFGPYFTDFYATPWGSAVNFDRAGSDEVRRFVIDNALMWLRDYHVDGLRVDAVHAIVDTSACHILEQLTGEVDALARALGRPLSVIAESDLNDPRIVRPREAGGFGCDAQWSDDFHHALHTVLTGETGGYYADFGSLADLAAALEHAYVYQGRWSAHRERTHGRAPDGLPPWRFLAYAQNHDQVGNRATGDRLSANVGAGRLKVAAALALTSPFVPLLFQGEEWGARTPFQYFTSHEDPELGRAVSQGRRSEFAAFGWRPDEVPDPQDVETFERSRLHWDDLEVERHRDLFAWYRELIALRRCTSALADGGWPVVRFDEHERWLVSERCGLAVAVNLAEGRRCVPVSDDRELRALLASAPDVTVARGAVELPPDSVAILAVTPR